MFPGRDPVNPQAGHDCAADVYAQAGITNPREQIDWPRSTCRSAGTSRCGWRTSASPAGRGLEDDRRRRDRDRRRLPGQPSGGVLSSNPIGASGMIRFAEAALQVRGHGGRAPGRRRAHRARPRVRRRPQFFAMWVVGEFARSLLELISGGALRTFRRLVRVVAGGVGTAQADRRRRAWRTTAGSASRSPGPSRGARSRWDQPPTRSRTRSRSPRRRRRAPRSSANPAAHWRTRRTRARSRRRPRRERGRRRAGRRCRTGRTRRRGVGPQQAVLLHAV